MWNKLYFMGKGEREYKIHMLEMMFELQAFTAYILYILKGQDVMLLNYSSI